MSEAELNFPNEEKEAPQLSSMEEKASARGWRPQEEWEGDPDEWVDARTFVQKGELMDTIHAERKRAKKLEQELDGVKSSVTDIQSHYEKLAKAEVEKTLKELKAQRREALRIDDHDTVDEIEERIDEIKSEKDKIEQAAKDQSTAPKAAPLPPEVSTWLKDNPWADENSSTYDEGMASEALSLLQAEVSRNGYGGTESLNSVKSKMERLYPEKFSTPKRVPTSVDGSHASNKGASKGKSGKFAGRLTEEQATIGKRFVQAGAVESMEEYAKQLNDMGELQ